MHFKIKWKYVNTDKLYALIMVGCHKQAKLYRKATFLPSVNDKWELNTMDN